MKKNLFGLFAIALAIAFSAFSTDTPEEYYFDINAEGNAFISSLPIPVEEALTQDCSGITGDYCQVVLDETQVDLENGQVKPKSSVNVSTELRFREFE